MDKPPLPNNSKSNNPSRSSVLLSYISQSPLSRLNIRSILTLAAPLLATLLSLLHPLPTTKPPTTTCKDIHIFLARGSKEPYPGRQLSTATTICNRLTKSCDYENIIYPAIHDEGYCTSVSTGISNARKAIEAYVEKCPESLVVLSGYSQGAHVVGDLLGGGGGTGCLGGGCVLERTRGMDVDGVVGRKVLAVLLFGDVRHTPGQPYNHGSGRDGQHSCWPRTETELQELRPWNDRIFSYCHAQDGVCAAGWGNGVRTCHFAYFGEHPEYERDVGVDVLGESARFVEGRLAVWEGGAA
ncbi:alpha/beta-hydrolase [Ascobolus immersus RN42]|uniref:Cutinase n=1 Tax=Ascobolus immersus RN42 TaxID=1160509 RepID=A0A3N4IR84_ASCIM|nr:alpha/beta-hydrolase [Ascobolus immersus RN42]